VLPGEIVFSLVRAVFAHERQEALSDLSERASDLVLLGGGGRI